MQGLTTIYDQGSEAEANIQNESRIASEKVSKGRMVIVIDIDKLASEGLIEQVSNVDEAIPLRNG
jgi:purine-binding chemotaxis protein CheW